MSEAIKHALLPCPFCGKTHTLIVGAASQMWDEDEHGPFPHTETYAVFCDASSDGHKCGCGGSGGYFLTKEEATEAWNRRSDALVERVKELEAAARPFANYACSPPGHCDCHNCKARDLLDKSLPNTVAEVKE